MWNNWLGRRIHDGARRLLLWGVLLCIGAAGIGWRARHNISDALATPPSVDSAQLAAELAQPETAAALRRRPVTVDSPEAVDTWASTVGGRRGETTGRYFALKAGDRWLLAKAPVPHEGTSFTGTLVDVSADELDRVIVPFTRDNKVDVQLFLPALLDGTFDTARGLVVGLFFTGLFLVPGLILIVVGLRRLRWPETHPLAQALRRFGPPAEVANAIAPSDPPVRRGPIEFVGDWLLCESPRTGYTVFRANDLVWVHRLIETVGNRPLHRVKLYDRLGMRFEGRGNEKEIEAAVAAVTERLPWLVVGWDERVAQQWRDDPASLVPRVEERRQELAARTPNRDPAT
jgi:hypothetical protein